MVAAALAASLTHPLHAQSTDAPVIVAPVIVVEECEVPAPQWSTDFESYVWNDICLYGYGGSDRVMESEVACNAAGQPQKTLDKITLSSDFLKTILTDPKYTAIRHTPKVVLECVHIPYLDLSEQTFRGSLTIRDSVIGSTNLYNTEVTGDLRLPANFFESPLHGDGLRVGRNLSLYESTFKSDVNMLDLDVRGFTNFGAAKVEGELDLERATIGKSLFLRKDAEFSDVSLDGATVAGQLEITDATISGDLNAWDLNTGGTVFLDDTEFQGHVKLTRLKTASNLSVQNTTIQGLLNLEGAKVSNSILIRKNTELHSIDLKNAVVGATVEFSNTTVADDFIADGLTVGSSLFMRENSSFAYIQLASAEVGVHLQLQNSDFHGSVDLTEARLGSLLLWRTGARNGSMPAGDARWHDTAALILRNTQVGSLQARMPQSWLTQSGKPLAVDLNGFQYQQMGGYSSGVENDLAQVNVKPLINWIRAAHPDDTGYSPQPYRALQQALERMGADGAARQVAYARLEHRAQTRITQGPFPNPGQWFIQATGMLWDRFLQITVGFGVYPQLAAFWFAALVGIGTMLARRSSKMCEAGKMDCFWYSLENAIPLIEPSEDHKIQHAEKRIRSFFHFQKVAGFVLASVLIGALTLGG